MPPLRPLSKLDELGDSVRQVIRAYHGSPYDFDKFDASRIGTGEGAQAYGYGLYFAKVEDTSKNYMTVQAPELTLGQEQELAAVIKRMRELKSLTKTVPQTDPRAAAMSEEWTRLQSRRAFLEDPPGHMYEVEIGYPEDSLLNWDRPAAPAGGVGAKAAEVLRAVRPRDIDAGTLEYIQSVRPGQYQRPAYGSSVDAAERALQRLALDRDGAAELRRAGIPGVKYLDGVSRQHGSGSRNYVMFPGTEDSIRILRKY